MSNYFCRVCGLKQADAPRGDDNQSPTFNICECCGVEFGYEDNNAESTKKYRQTWVDKNYQWFDPKAMPDNWDRAEQMKNIPADFV